VIPVLVSLLFVAQAAAAPPQVTVPSAPSTNASPSAPPQNAAPGKPAQNATPGKPIEPPPPDPATTQFLTDAGLIFVAVKPAAVADYELAIVTLQGALSKSTDPAKMAVAKGWRVFKSAELDAKTNQLYVHLILPAVAGFDYRPSLLIDELLKELAPELLNKYADSFAQPPTKLSLTELANMAVAPLPPTTPTGTPTNATPTNVTPTVPVTKKPSGG
jgi:hypothetical protein